MRKTKTYKRRTKKRYTNKRQINKYFKKTRKICEKGLTDETIRIRELIKIIKNNLTTT